MDLPTFVARFPEFAGVAGSNRAFLQAALDEATARVDTSNPNPNTDFLIGLRAAEYLWSSPFGANARLGSGSDEKVNPYTQRRKDLEREIFGGPWVSGQASDGSRLQTGLTIWPPFPGPPVFP